MSVFRQICSPDEYCSLSLQCAEIYKAIIQASDPRSYTGCYALA